MAVPPLRPLQQVLSALESAGISAVVGGSALLVSLGLAESANDWDVVTDADPDAVAAALEGGGFAATHGGPSGQFASEALFRIDQGDAHIDVISRFAVRSAEGRTVAVPARLGARWRGLPMARRDDWWAAYTAMGRTAQASLLSR